MLSMTPQLLFEYTMAVGMAALVIGVVVLLVLGYFFGE